MEPSDEINVGLYDDTSGRILRKSFVKGISDQHLGFAGVSGGHVMKLKDGEKVWIQNIGAVASLHSHHTTFTGFRIGEFYMYLYQKERDTSR